MQKVQGIIQLVSALAPVVSVAGVVVSAIPHLVSSFLGTLGDWHTGKAVETLITEALEKYRSQELREKGAGVGKEFAVALGYMGGLGTNPTSKEIDDLLRVFTPQTGVKFLGELMSNIQGHAGKKKNEKEARELLEAVRLYCQLSSMREFLLYQMYYVMANSQGAEEREGTLRAIQKVLDVEKSCNRDLEFLLVPSLTQIYIALAYTPAEYPEIAQYLKHLGTPDPPVPEPLDQVLRVAKYPTYFLKVSAPWLGPTAVELCEGQGQDEYKLTFTDQKNGYYSIRSGKDDLSIHSRFLSWVQMRVLLTRENKVLLVFRGGSSFLYCKFSWDLVRWQSELATWHGEPGPQGHWLISMRYDGKLIQPQP